MHEARLHMHTTLAPRLAHEGARTDEARTTRGRFGALVQEVARFSQKIDAISNSRSELFMVKFFQHHIQL
jgi:hypothetical protein